MSSKNDHRPTNEMFKEMAADGVGDSSRGWGKSCFLDPPDHTRIRRLAGKAFTPRAVEAMRPHIEELVDGLLDAVADGGGMDVISDLAKPLPVTVISEMLGLPESDLPQLTEWSGAMTKLLDPGDDLSIFLPAQDAMKELEAYLDELMAKRRVDPGDDLLSAFLHVEDEGAQLTDDEVGSTVMLLFGAGHETTVNLIGNGLLALLRQRDQWERLCDEPGLVKSAVEEMLRFDSPVQLTGRAATCDLQITARGHQGQQSSSAGRGQPRPGAVPGSGSPRHRPPRQPPRRLRRRHPPLPGRATGSSRGAGGFQGVDRSHARARAGDRRTAAQGDNHPARSGGTACHLVGGGSLGPMDVRYPREADEYREKVQAFLAEHLPADWKGIGALEPDAARDFTNEWRRTLYDNKYLAVNWPVEYGGAGLSALERGDPRRGFHQGGRAPRRPEATSRHPDDRTR